MRTIGVAVVGLGFGEEFLPIYRKHPNVGRIAIVDSDPARLAAVGDRYGIADRYTDLDAVLSDDRIDAVHLLTPVAYHALHAIAALSAGKHSMSAVPMATSLADIDAIIAAQRASGRAYMMMETTVLRSRVSRRPTRCTGAARSATSRSIAGSTSRTSTAFRPTGRVTRRCTTSLMPCRRFWSARHHRRERDAAGAGRLAARRRIGGFDNPFPSEVGAVHAARQRCDRRVTMSFFQTARSVHRGLRLYGERTRSRVADRQGGRTLSGFDCSPC